jgi:transposase
MNEQHQLDVWTTALNLSEYEVVHYAQRDGVRRFSLVPICHAALCPDCRKPSGCVHQKRWIENVVDLPLGDLPVRLKVRVLQFECEHCQRYWTPEILFLTPGMGAKATARFVGQAAELIGRADISGVAAFYGVPRKSLEQWYYQWEKIQRQPEEEEAPAQPIRSLGVDEWSLKKRHQQYVLAIIDHTNHRVLDVLESREKHRLKAYFQAGLKSGLFAELAEVTTDMWAAYGNAAKEVFGDSVRITIDRFHVMKNLQEQLTKARRTIQRELPEAACKALKGSRFLWLKNEESLTPEESRTLKNLCREYPRLEELRQQRERLRAIFEDRELTTASAGRQRLKAWLKEARSLGLKALDQFCQTLDNWLDGIANYFVSRSSNGPTEGFNNGFRSILSRAFGMQNFENFRARVLHFFGKPKPQESPKLA